MSDLFSSPAASDSAAAGTLALPTYPDLLPGFEWQDLDANGVRIRAAVGGAGPPLLLLHGHPRTHLTWHRVAPALSERFTVVCTDLRGYGDSAKPPGEADHRGYSKRAMAADQVAVMAALGHARFGVLAHDRGARVAHRMALDHPHAVQRLALLDIVPTATMYALADREFATRYWWWFFLIQPFDLPERALAADPEYFLDRHLAEETYGRDAMDPRVHEAYLRCYSDPATRHAMCEDYRAAASIDLEHDRADADERVQVPLLVLWGAHSPIAHWYDVRAAWREKARDVRGQALDCGHCPQEEVPKALLAALDEFF